MAEQGKFEDPMAVIKDTLGGAPTAPGSPAGAPPVATGVPTTDTTPIAPGAPQSPQTQPQGIVSKVWDYVKGAYAQDASARQARGSAAVDTITKDVGDSWDTLKRDFVASTSLNPDARKAFHQGDFWGEMKSQFDSMVQTGKAPLDAFNLAISPITGAGDAATGALAHAAFQVLPHVPGFGESEFHQALNNASGLMLPESGGLARSLGELDASHTKVVSGRASTSFSTTPGAIASEHEADVSSLEAQGTEAAGRKNAAGGPADANKVTFQAKPSGTSSDAWRNVGTMDKGDLQRFYDQANSYAGKSTDVTEETAPELHQGIGQVTLSTFKSPKDATLFMRAALDNIPAQMRPMSDEMLAQQVKDGAAAIGVSRDSLTTFINNTARDSSRLPQAVGIVRAAYDSIARAISTDAAGGLAEFSDEDLEGARGHMQTGESGVDIAGDRSKALANKLLNVQTAINWGSSFSDIGTGLGRGLRALQLPAVDMDAVMTHLQGLNGDAAPPIAGSNQVPPQSLQDLDKFYRLWNAAGDDPTSRMKLLQGRSIVPTPGWYLRNSFANAFTGSLLAGKAIVKGYLMPGFMGALQTFERTSAAGLAAINPLLSAEDRATFASIAKSSAMSYFQTMGDFASAFRYSIDATRKGGKSIIRGGGSTAMQDSGRSGPITQEMLDASQKTGDWRYTLGNAINVWPRAVFSLVGGHDELTNRLAYLGRIRMTAQVAAQRAGITDPLAVKDYIDGAMADAVDPSTGAATHPDILNEASRASFMNSTQGGPMGPLIQQLNNARQSVPELRYIMPVLNVPANGLGEGIRRLPGVNLMFEQTRRELSGEAGQIAQAEAYGRMITGVTLLGTAFGLSRAGLMTGGGPENPADRANWENNGYQPYSFKVDNKWVSYKDWEPAGSIMGIMAGVVDYSVHSPEDDQTHSAVLAGTAALAEYAKDKAAMQGISNMLSFGEGGSSTPDSFFKRTFGSIASGFEPAFMKYIRNATDPELRSKSSVWDYVKNGLPGLSSTLPPLRNTFGEPIHQPNDASNVYGLMPWTISAANSDHHDPVANELDNIYQTTGYAGGVTHPQELSKGFYDPAKVTLENGRTMFDQFAANRLEPNSAWDGQNVKQHLTELFNSDDYKSAVMGSPSKATDPNTDQASKLYMIQKTFREANTFSKEKLAQDSPIAKRYLAVGQAKSDSPDLLRTYKADDLVTNPPLLKSLGIDLDQYEQKVGGQ